MDESPNLLQMRPKRERTPFGQRLFDARTNAGLSQTALSKMVGMAQGTLGEAEVTAQGSSYTSQIAQAAGVRAEWLATGKGAMLQTSTDRQGAQTNAAYRRATDSDVEILQYDAAGAMGRGLVLEERPPGLIKAWRVDHEWLRLNVGSHTGVGNLCIVTGFGPSMQPKYNPGDPLLLDRGVTAVDQDGIFFFRVGNLGYIKQLQRIPTEGGLIIRAKSLNKDYDPFDITVKMDLQVFGKVLTVWRSEQF
jgi:phage repressor protein C with HTH and peptisase S24 domain